MEVTAPPGTLVGTVQQEWSLFTPQFSVKDAGGNVVLRIKGPFCTFSFCGDVEFKVIFLQYLSIDIKLTHLNLQPIFYKALYL